MIRLTFVYILYSLLIVCMYKKHTKVISVSLLYKFCIVCTLFVASYVQKTYKSRFGQLVVQVLYSFYNVCMYKKHTFQVSRRFWSKLCTSFVHFVQFLYYMQLCRNVMMQRTFIIIQNFDLYDLCIQNVYKFSALYNFCIHYVQFLYKFFGKFFNMQLNNQIIISFFYKNFL